MSYYCTECGYVAVQKIARCPQCKKLNSVVKSGESASHRPIFLVRSTDPLGQLPVRLVSGQEEYDRILGGGIERGYTQIIAGEGGCGKSTLVLQVAGGIAASGSRVLYVCGEEQIHRVQRRAERLGALHSNLLFTQERDGVALCSLIDKEKYDLVVVDSLQTIHVEGKHNEIDTAAWMIGATQRNNIATILVSQVTKAGDLAGRSAVNHMVDTVLYLDGSGENIRILRAKKNRGGDVGDVGCFTMSNAGLQPVEDLASLFLTARPNPIVGAIVTIQPVGKRLAPTEIHALFQEDGSGKTVVAGVSKDRVEILRAVLSYHLPDIWEFRKADVYLSVPGGLEVSESSADLAIIALLVGLVRRVPTSHLCVLGEVALSGETVQKPSAAKWATFAKKRGFEVWMPTENVDVAIRGFLSRG